MEFVFYNIASYVQALDDELLSNLHIGSNAKVFHCIGEQALKGLPTGTEYIVFYLFSDKKGCKQICEMSKGNKWKIKKVALCKDYREGITAMEKGNDYALKVPIEKEKLLYCINYLMEEKNERDKNTFFRC